MPRPVEFEGRLIEVPDDATDDEVSEILATSAGTEAGTGALVPTAATSTTTRSVANTARARLAKRGLTPERIKADPSLSVTRPGQIRSVRPRVTDGGFLHKLGQSFNPKEIVAGLGERGVNLMMHTIDPLGSDPALPADERTSRGVDMTDLGAPDLPALYQEAARRGQANESLAGMYGSATGQSILLGGGALASRMIRNAPATAAAAEAEYTEATGAHGPTFGPKPIAREMLDRRIVVGPDPPEQAATQRASAAATNAERSAIPGARPVRGPGGRLQPSTDPVDVANTAQRAELRSRAQVEANIASILDAIPETESLGGAVRKGANHFAKSRLTAMVYGPGAMVGTATKSLAGFAALSPLAVTHLLWSISKELVKTNQWRTALPIYKTQFANALMTGNADLAASTGALIANGKGASAELNTDINTNTSSSSSSSSKLSSLSGQSPNESLRDSPGQGRDSTPAAGDWTSEDYYSEFNPYSVPFEGSDLLDRKSPTSLLPSRFKHAKSVTLGQEIRPGSVLPSKALGVYGEPTSPEDRKGYNPLLHRLESFNDPKSADFPNVTLAHDTDKAASPLSSMHEYGHAAWRGGDVTPAEKQEWTEIHNGRLASVQAGTDLTKDRTIPVAIKYYAGDPGHSFAELFGTYVVAPTEFKQRYPAEYNYFKRVFGQEYTVAARAASRLAGNPNAIGRPTATRIDPLASTPTPTSPSPSPASPTPPALAGAVPNMGVGAGAGIGQQSKPHWELPNAFESGHPYTGVDANAAAAAITTPPINRSPATQPDAFTEQERKLWPQIEAELQENTAWLKTTSPAKVLPPHLKTAISAAVFTVMGKDMDRQHPGFKHHGGAYGSVPADGSTLEEYTRKHGHGPNTIAFAPGMGAAQTLYHEYGHAAANDLPESVIEDWKSYIKKKQAPAIAARDAEFSSVFEAAENRPEFDSLEDEDRYVAEIAKKHGDALGKVPALLPLWMRTNTHERFYERGGSVDFDTSWGETLAEAFSWYIVAPKLLKKTDPDTYRWLNRKVFKGQEYIDGKITRPSVK